MGTLRYPSPFQRFKDLRVTHRNNFRKICVAAKAMRRVPSKEPGAALSPKAHENEADKRLPTSGGGGDRRSELNPHTG